MAGRRLRLTRSQVVDVNYKALGAYRLRVDVSDPDETGADPNVFLYLRRPVNPHNSDQDDDCHAVASPADMAEYPVGGPRDGTAYPFYRLDYFEIDLRSTTQVERVYAAVIAQVSNLVDALNRLDVLTQTDEVWIGATAEPASSSSSSSSA